MTKRGGPPSLTPMVMTEIQENARAVATVAGVRVAFEPEGAAYLPASRALIVSDLHLEKGSAFAQRGVLLPPYDTRATLERLAGVMARLAPRVVISLGDSFHDAACEARMGQADREMLTGLVAQPEDWIWIEGNHDPAPPAHIGGRVAGELALGGLVFRHEPLDGETAGEAAGHLHPCARVSGRGRSVRRRAFVTDGQRLILPAFGAYAGGLNVRDPAFAGLFAQPPTAFMLGRDRVWPVASRRLAPD